jgi:hypothetical protein
MCLGGAARGRDGRRTDIRCVAALLLAYDRSGRWGKYHDACNGPPPFSEPSIPRLITSKLAQAGVNSPLLYCAVFRFGFKFGSPRFGP